MPATMPATRNQLLARLHCIKKEQGWDDDTYRDILYARTGHRSASELDGPALARVVAALGVQKPPAHEWSWVDTAAESRRPLLRKLIMLAGPKGAGIARGRQVAYIEGIARQMAGGVAKPLRLCDEHDLWCIVAALAKHIKRRQ